MLIVDDSQAAETRTFARVDDVLAVRVRPIDRAEAQRIAEEFGAGSAPVPAAAALSAATDADLDASPALQAIHERLAALERTVGAIAAHLGVDDGASSDLIVGETVSVSGSGCGIRVPQRFSRGEWLEVQIDIPADRPRTVRAVARVASLVHADGETVPVGRYHLGVAFAAIRDDDREALIKHTFRVQRQMLRERKS